MNETPDPDDSRSEEESEVLATIPVPTETDDATLYCTENSSGSVLAEHQATVSDQDPNSVLAMAVDQPAVNISVLQGLSSNEDDNDFTDMQFSMDIEDFLPDTLPGEESPTEAPLPPPKFSHTIQVNNKPVLKSSAVRLLSSNRAKKVTMRTLRAAGAVLEDFHKSKHSDLLEPMETDTDLTIAGDLGAFLVLSNEKVSMAILEVTNFLVGKEKALRTSVNTLDLSNIKSEITVVGQVIELKQPDPDQSIWEWTKRYLQTKPSAKGSELLTRNQFVIEFSSVLLYPLGPYIARQYGETSSPNLSWRFHRSQLQEVLNLAWNSLNPDNSDKGIANIQTIPAIINPTSMPYRNRSGMEVLIPTWPYKYLLVLSRRRGFLCQGGSAKPSFAKNTWWKRKGQMLPMR